MDSPSVVISATDPRSRSGESAGADRSGCLSLIVSYDPADARCACGHRGDAARACGDCHVAHARWHHAATVAECTRDSVVADAIQRRADREYAAHVRTARRRAERPTCVSVRRVARARTRRSRVVRAHTASRSSPSDPEPPRRAAGSAVRS